LRLCILRVLLCSVCFCTGHFVMVPIKWICPHCLQHFFFEHLFHLYWNLILLAFKKRWTHVHKTIFRNPYMHSFSTDKRHYYIKNVQTDPNLDQVQVSTAISCWYSHLVAPWRSTLKVSHCPILCVTKGHVKQQRSRI